MKEMRKSAEARSLRTILKRSTGFRGEGEVGQRVRPSTA
jgi:hypothetical protein